MEREIRFTPHSLVHIYILAKNAGVLFYRISDRLAAFSVVSVLARKHRLSVSGMCFMFTHIHKAIMPVDIMQQRAFERDVMSILAKMFNSDRRLSGPVFNKPFGWASKKDPKSQKSCIVYILNNPPEKKLCRHAAEDRWNFLAYYNNPNPFSKPLVKHNASYYLKEACGIIDREFAAGRYLKPAALRLMFSKIKSAEEREQLVDYIITKYNFIDYDSAVKLFGSYDNMVAATDAMTGAEYDISEVYGVRSDVPYIDMVRYASKDGLLGPEMRLLHLDGKERTGYIRRYSMLPGVTDRHIKAFFHLEQ